LVYYVQLGGIISEKLIHPMTWLLHLVLWFLSTWIGTIILCGMGCLSTKFPFIHTFPDLPLHKRQQILQTMSLSFFRLLRMFFKTIKILTLREFFTQVRNIFIFYIKYTIVQFYLLSVANCNSILEAYYNQ
jgi:long-chain-alcohol oxidase